MPPTGRTDVLVLGAGIAGLALARHLARRGVAVTVVDPGPRAGGATGRAAGVVTEQLWDPWDISVTRAAQAEARRLLADADPPAYWENGFLRYSTRPEVAEPLADAARRLAGLGVEARIVDAATIEAVVPGARMVPDTVGLLSDGAACVTPSALAGAYAAAAAADGAELLDAAGPRPPPTWNGEDWILEAPQAPIRAARLVVAAGAWTKAILASLGAPRPLCPYRTQAALIRPSATPGAGPFPTVHDIDTDVYVRPELAGRVLAGDGTESTEADPTRFVPGGDASFLAHLAEALATPFPAWGSGEVVSAWAGVCTATPDRRPMVGALAEVPELFLMAGFNGFGVMRAGGVADRFAEALAAGGDRGAAWDALRPVRPDRFPPGSPTFAPRPGFTLEAGDSPRF